MNNIDILEKELKELCKSGKRIKIEDMKRIFVACDLIETLIAENKELKDSNVELATTIDCLQTDLKEINEEYNAEQKHEMENTIPKSKVEEEIDGKFKEAKGLYERGVQPQAQHTMKLLRDLEQSLLGKE